MGEKTHNALKIKESAQAAVHGKIGDLDHQGLVDYFASRRKPVSPQQAASADGSFQVRESDTTYPKRSH